MSENSIEELQYKYEKALNNLIKCEKEKKEVIKNSISRDEVRNILNKAECEDYYMLTDVIDDLEKLLQESEKKNV